MTGTLVGKGAHTGFDIQFFTFGLILLPAPRRGQGGELGAQAARGGLQVLGQGGGLGVAGGHGLQAAPVGLHLAALPVPFGQRYAWSQRNVVFGGGGQVQVEAHLAGDTLVVACQGQLVHVLGLAGDVRVGVVVGVAIELDVFGPRQQALGAEHEQEGRFVFRHVGTFGLVTLVPAFLLIAAAFGVARGVLRVGGGLGAVRAGTQPQGYGLDVLGFLARQGGQGADAAGFTQGLTDGAFACRFIGRQTLGRQALGQGGGHQALIAWFEPRVVLQHGQSGLLIVLQPGVGAAVGRGAGGQGREP